MQTAHVPTTTTAQTGWRPRIDPSRTSSANGGLPPGPPTRYQSPSPPLLPPGYLGPPPGGGLPHRPPTRYQGPSPPPLLPRYPDSPPGQLPASVSTHQRSKGYWRFDPEAGGWSSASEAPSQQPPQQPQYYNPGTVSNDVLRPAPQQAGGLPGWGQTWMPHPGWQMPADPNPDKRMPKEPDPSYFSFELSENPLGLENMHITYVFTFIPFWYSLLRIVADEFCISVGFDI